jgi:hypothetical protein
VRRRKQVLVEIPEGKGTAWKTNEPLKDNIEMDI